jgi:hypothetical protein
MSATIRSHPNFLQPLLLALFLALFLAAAIPLPLPAQSQEPSAEGEWVANLAAGRLVIAVVKGGMVIAAVENPVEPATRPPQIVPLAGNRVGILLGAVDWSYISPKTQIARLGTELPRLRSQRSGGEGRPHLQPGGPVVSSEAKKVGLGMLERLRDVATHIHGQLDLGPEGPIVELVLAGYDEDNGGEVWLLRYTITQEQQRGDYWETRVNRPSYHRLWPPDKGQPHSLVEVHYPADDSGASLADLLRQGDPRLARIRQGDAALAKVADLLTSGESRKANFTDTVQFLRAALTAIAPENAKQAIATINGKEGFAWVLEPPSEKAQAPRPPGAPTLQKPNE